MEVFILWNPHIPAAFAKNVKVFVCSYAHNDHIPNKTNVIDIFITYF